MTFIGIDHIVITVIPVMFQNLGISQSQRLRFDPIEAASYPRDRSDADRVKDQDADTGKNKVLNHERYNLDFFFDNCEIK